MYSLESWRWTACLLLDFYLLPESKNPFVVQDIAISQNISHLFYTLETFIDRVAYSDQV